MSFSGETVNAVLRDIRRLLSSGGGNTPGVGYATEATLDAIRDYLIVQDDWATEQTLALIEQRLGQNGNAANPIGSQAAQLNSIWSELNTWRTGAGALRSLRQDYSGTTDSTPSTWTQVIPPDPTRTTWLVQLSNSATVTAELACGDSGSEILIAELIPGASFYESVPDDVNPMRIAIRSSAPSESYIAWSN